MSGRPKARQSSMDLDTITRRRSDRTYNLVLTGNPGSEFLLHLLGFEDGGVHIIHVGKRRLQVVQLRRGQINQHHQREVLPELGSLTLADVPAGLNDFPSNVRHDAQSILPDGIDN